MLTDALYFDTDCISSFLWVNQEVLLTTMYSGSIHIPRSVYDELSNPNIPHIKARVDNMIFSGHADICSIDVTSEEYAIFYQLTVNPTPPNRVIGDGEAAALAFAKVKQATIASNNLKDISTYVDYYNLRLITTGDILIESLKHNLITEQEGNQIWANMLNKRRKIGAPTFSDYLHAHHSK